MAPKAEFSVMIISLLLFTFVMAKPNYPSERTEEEICRDFPCGANATCTVLSAPSGKLPGCKCYKLHDGNPYEECKPVECDEHEQCAKHEACQKHKCGSPCGVCGTNSICEVYQHIAICSCPIGHTGDPSESCVKFSWAPSPRNFLSYSTCDDRHTCGPNSSCTLRYGKAICSCVRGYVYDLSWRACRKTCDTYLDCPRGFVCSGNSRCVEPVAALLR